MNKTVLLISATIFSIAGGYIPYLWGDDSFFGGWSILFGTIGGLIGIFIGVWFSKRWLQ